MNNKNQIEYEELTEIIDYLNLKANKRYRYTSKSTNMLINNRTRDGFTVEDFKKVIDTKCNQWLNNEKMKIYLRPETLFGHKFESYLNE